MARATGVGAFPGGDVREATRIVRDLLGADGLPYLPELPGRGPGADLIGRGAALLTGVPVDLQPSGWRLSMGSDVNARRAASWLAEDLDALAETYDGWTGELKLQVAGPWTLAGSIWLPRGERVVADRGAVRDLVESLADGVAGFLGRARQMVPGATWVVQVDEPGLTAVVEGALPTASGLSRLAATPAEAVREGLRSVVDAVRAADAVSVVHSCAGRVPVALIGEAGAAAAMVDPSLVGAGQDDALAAAAEAGVAVWPGLVPATGTMPAAQDLVGRLERWWTRVGLDLGTLGGTTVSPACGSPAGTLAEAVARLRRTVECADALTQRFC